MNLSFQLYSARDHQPWSKVFPMLASLGYDRVEGYGALYEDPPALAKLLADHSLTMPTAHFDLAKLENDFEDSVALARMLGVETVVGPYLAEDARPADLAGWKALAGRLSVVGTRLADEGFGFAWHNHDFELRPCKDGSIPLDVLLDEVPQMGWEADLAWVVRGGADPGDWVRARADRIVAVHLKDLAAPGECADEDGWADVGHGTMDWQGLSDQLATSATRCVWIVEHDNPADLERFARRSMASVRKYRGEAS